MYKARSQRLSLSTPRLQTTGSPSVEPPNGLVKGSLLAEALLGVGDVTAHAEAVGSATVEVELPGLRDVVGEQGLDLSAPRGRHHGVSFWKTC